LNELIPIVSAAVSSGIASYGVAKWLIRHGGPVLRHDLPGIRSLHKHVTPRGGGLGLLVLVPAACLLVQGEAVDTKATIWWLFGLALPNGLLGAFDDCRPLPPQLKLILQFVIAYTFASAGYIVHFTDLSLLGAFGLEWTAPLLTSLWVVWLTNVFNFMDGMDALAGVSGIIFMTGLTVIEGSSSGTKAGISGACIIAAGAVAGFLILNRPPARIFMGDGGALFIGGMLAGATVLLSEPGKGVPFAAPLLLMGTFVFDAGYTLIRRLFAGERVLEPHCSHLYQRLARSGWSHAQVRSLYFGLNLMMGGGALILVYGDVVLRFFVWLISVSACVGLVAVTRSVERLSFIQQPMSHEQK